MRREILLALTAVTATLFVAPAEAQRGCGGPQGGGRLEIVGLTNDQELICFSENNPGGAGSLGRVRGLTGDTRLVGIDFRPATGDLYGLGDAGGVYVISTRNGAATFRSKLNVTLTGASFGIDFNPTVDRLRIVSDTGQNLRANVDTGETTTDTALAYTAGTTTTGITAAAYTNNDANPNTGTTLYGLDSTLDQLLIQAPPNGGSLNATGKLTVNAGTATGFDIYSELLRGFTVDVHAFASLQADGRSRLYKINLFSGRAVPRGAFRGQTQVIDIAIPLNQL